MSNAPMLALDGSVPSGAGPDRPALAAVHYPAAEIERQLALLSQTRSNEATSGLVLIFSSAGLEAARNGTPSLTLSLNTLPPGQTQRAHRHNAAAITLAVQGDGCFSTVGGVRRPWTLGSTLVTPPGAPHSHHNPGGVGARFLIVQDGGLHYHARMIGFEFLEQPAKPAAFPECGKKLPSRGADRHFLTSSKSLSGRFEFDSLSPRLSGVPFKTCS